MLSLDDHIRRHGGLIATHELHAIGVSRSGIRSAVSAGSLVRVRQGWYASPDEQPVLIEVARVGGRATCQSAARARGLWVPADAAGLHVSVHPDRTQLRSPTSAQRRLDRSPAVRVHWDDSVTPKGARRRLLVPAEQMVRDLIGCADVEDAFVMIESALERGVLGARAWARMRESVPTRSPLRAAAGLSGSGTESMFRFRMPLGGIVIRQQVLIGIDRVDFLIGARLVIEIDSRAHHDAVADRRRDARLSVLGYRVLRFGYDLVISDWPLVEAAVTAAITRRDHIS